MASYEKEIGQIMAIIEMCRSVHVGLKNVEKQCDEAKIALNTLLIAAGFYSSAPVTSWIGGVINAGHDQP